MPSWRARALRAALRELALANTLGDRARCGAPRARSTPRSAPSRSSSARASTDAGVAPAGAGARRGLGALVAVVAAARAARDLGAAQGVPPGDVRLALLRRVPQPLVELVLDADLRRPEKARAYRRRRMPDGPRDAERLVRASPSRSRRLVRPQGGALVAALGIAAGDGRARRDPRRSDGREGPQRRPGGRAASRRRRAPCAPSWFGVPAGGDEAWPLARPQRARRARGARRPAARPRSRSSARARSAGASSASPPSTGSPRTSCSAPVGCRARARPSAARCCGSAARERCRTSRASASSRSARRRSARASSSATSSRRPTTRSPTRSSRPPLARARRYHRPPPAPLVVAEGVAALVVLTGARALLPELRAGCSALGAGTPRLWQIDELVARADQRAAAAPGAVDRMVARGPRRGARRETEHATTVAGRRLLLVGGEAAALLVAFAVLAAGRSGATSRGPAPAHLARRAALAARAPDGDRERGRRLRRRASPAGSSVPRRRRRRAAAPARPSVPCCARACSRRPGSLLGLATAVARAARDRGDGLARRRGRRGRVGALDLAAVVGAARRPRRSLASGAVDARRPRRGRRGALRSLLVLPGLVAFAAAVGASRLLPAVGRLAARRGRSGQCPPRRRLARALARRGRRSRRRSSRSPSPSPSSPRRTGRRSQTRRARPGGLRRAGRRRRPRGPALARPRAPGRPARALRRAPGRRGRPSGAAAHRERRPRRVRLRRHRARRAPGGTPRGAALAGRLGRHAERALADAVERAGSDALRGADPAGLASSRLAVGPGPLSLRATRRAARRPLPRRSTSAAPTADGPTVLARRLPARGAGREARRARARRRRGCIDRGADAGHRPPRGARHSACSGVSLDGWIGEGGVTSARPLDRCRHACRLRGHGPASRPRPRRGSRRTTIRRRRVVTPRARRLAGGVGGHAPAPYRRRAGQRAGRARSSTASPGRRGMPLVADRERA